MAGRATVRPVEDPDDDPPLALVPVPVVSLDGRASVSNDVPYPLRIAAAWFWRLLVVAAGAAAVLWVVGRLHQVVVPVAISLLLSALLSPAVSWLRKRVRLHRSLATALVMVSGLAVVFGVLTLVITQFVNSW